MRKSAIFRICRFFALMSSIWGLAGPVPATAAAVISQGAYIDSNGKGCPNSSSCTANTFSPIPAQKTLIVRDVSCTVRHSTSATPLYFYMGGNGRSTFLALGPAATVGSVRYYNSNTSVFNVLLAGQTPYIAITLSSAGPVLQLSCTIAGDLKPFP